MVSTGTKKFICWNSKNEITAEVIHCEMNVHTKYKWENIEIGFLCVLAAVLILLIVLHHGSQQRYL